MKYEQDQDVYYDRFVSYRCNRANIECQNFLRKIPIDLDRVSVRIFTISFSVNYPEPVYFLLQEQYSRETLVQFVTNFKDKKLQRFIVSQEENPIKFEDEYLFPNTSILTRETIINFFIKNRHNDILIYFYSSRDNVYNNDWI